MERRKFLGRLGLATIAIPATVMLAKEVKQEPIQVMLDDSDDLFSREHKKLVRIEDIKAGKGIVEQIKEREIVMYTDKWGAEQFEKAIKELYG